MASNLLYQYYAGICVNIISISYGAFCGWPSASFLELQSPNSPLETGPMTNAEVGFVGSMLCVGGLLGTIFFSWCAEKIGRKRCLLLVAIPSLAGWGIIRFAKNPFHLSLSRFFGGFAGGGSFCVIPIYVTEFAEDRIRGTLGSLLVLSCNIGILLAFLLGNFFSYVTVALILSLLTVLFLLFFSCLPETPQYLAKRDKIEEAEKALRSFRNVGNVTSRTCAQFELELEKIKGDETTRQTNDSITWSDLTNETAIKALVIAVALMFLNQFCGCFAMINYTATIFQLAGSNLSPNISAIIVAIIQLLGSYVSTMLVERAGRKFLLIISSIGTGIGLICLGGYCHLTLMGFETKAYNWIPVASFSFTIFIACWGIVTLPFLVLSEVMPPKIRNFGSMLGMSLLYIFAFFLLKYFPVMSEVLGMHGVMYIFAASCFLGAAFIVKYIPETKGKSIDAILEML